MRAREPLRGIRSRAPRAFAARARQRAKKSDARLVLLGLLVLAAVISGAAFSVLNSIWTSRTGQALELTAAGCGSDGATLYLRNIGVQNMSLSSISVSKRVLAGTAPDTLQLSASFSVLTPLQAGTLTDADCSTLRSPAATCEYTLRAGGSVLRSQVTC